MIQGNNEDDYKDNNNGNDGNDYDHQPQKL